MERSENLQRVQVMTLPQRFRRNLVIHVVLLESDIKSPQLGHPNYFSTYAACYASSEPY
jgi:hypothetical protein